MFKADIIYASEEPAGRQFTERLWGKRPTYAVVIGNTETAKIPGVSAAGAVPEITDFTPAADVELLFYGRCKCIDGVPVTPTGVPTPGIITMSALQLASVPLYAINGGVRVRPHTPFFDVEGTPGEDIRTGRALKDPRRVYENSVLLGRELAKNNPYLVIGESIAGGTTTALATLLAMGYDGKGKVSSSMIDNPHSVKTDIALEGVSNSPFSQEDMRTDPMKALQAVGDPMMPAAAGVVAGAAETIPVLMAGGTQMAAVMAIVKGMAPGTLSNLALGTTKWIVQDRSSDIRGIVEQIGKVPILAADLDFSASAHDGLSIYEKGLVKEGVGAGGISVATFLQTQGRIGAREMLEAVESNYVRLMAIMGK
ncbi:MAG TPA: TIGR00303 family protein [Methanomassiliicoccales archaeon]|nr:TIGR00303 family protein [Methanomassiliicoccales archaeon]